MCVIQLSVARLTAKLQEQFVLRSPRGMLKVHERPCGCVRVLFRNIIYTILWLCFLFTVCVDGELPQEELRQGLQGFVQQGYKYFHSLGWETFILVRCYICG